MPKMTSPNMFKVLSVCAPFWRFCSNLPAISNSHVHSHIVWIYRNLTKRVVKDAYIQQQKCEEMRVVTHSRHSNHLQYIKLPTYKYTKLSPITLCTLTSSRLSQWLGGIPGSSVGWLVDWLLAIILMFQPILRILQGFSLSQSSSQLVFWPGVYRVENDPRWVVFFAGRSTWCNEPHVPPTCLHCNSALSSLPLASLTCRKHGMRRKDSRRSLSFSSISWRGFQPKSTHSEVRSETPDNFLEDIRLLKNLANESSNSTGIQCQCPSRNWKSHWVSFKIII